MGTLELLEQRIPILMLPHSMVPYVVSGPLGAAPRSANLPATQDTPQGAP